MNRLSPIAAAGVAGFEDGATRMIGALAAAPSGASSERYEYLLGLRRALRRSMNELDAEIAALEALDGSSEVAP